MDSSRANQEAPAATGGILARDDGSTIAYDKLPGKNPGILFLHGFRSDRTGIKARALEDFCRRRGQAYLRFDVRGHGDSSGRFEDGTIGQWADDAVFALDRLTEGPQILVGSSMGGWLALLAALRRPGRVAALVGLSAAPDFIENCIYQAFDDDQRRHLLQNGRIDLPACGDRPELVITRRLVEDARNHLLLDAPINIRCPVRLVHGQQDASIPWKTVLSLAGCLTSEDVEVTLVKGAGHRLSEPADLRRTEHILESLLRQIEAQGA